MLPHTAAQETIIPDWLQIIRAEYSEMPGLSLTRPQVERLWTLDKTTSEAVLTMLVGVGFLRCTMTGKYVRAGNEG
jgi:hypothetical protein